MVAPKVPEPLAAVIQPDSRAGEHVAELAAELDGSLNVEPPASTCATAGEVDVDSWTAAGHGDCTVADIIRRNLTRLRTLQLQSLNDADGRSVTLINQELDSIETRTMGLMEHLIDGVRQGKSWSGSEDRIAQVRELVYHHRTVESNWIGLLLSRMEAEYRKLCPSVSDEVISTLLGRFDGLISVGVVVPWTDRMRHARHLMITI